MLIPARFHVARQVQKPSCHVDHGVADLTGVGGLFLWQPVALAGAELEKKYWWIEGEDRKRPRPVRQGSRVFRIMGGCDTQVVESGTFDSTTWEIDEQSRRCCHEVSGSGLYNQQR